MFRPVSSTRRWSYINEELLRQSDLPRPAHLYACFFFFFNDTATTEIYTLSLHDALPILREHPVFWTCGIRYCLAVEAVSLVPNCDRDFSVNVAAARDVHALARVLTIAVHHGSY